MKKIIILLLSLTVLLTACTKKDSASTYYYQFKDSLGNEVVLKEKPERVAVLFSSYAEIWSLAKGEIVCSVGDAVKRGFVDSDVELADSGAGLKLDMEKLVAAKPDFVIVTADLSAQLEAYEVMKEAGVACAAFREESLDDYLAILKIFTDINGCPEVYDEYGTNVKKEVEDIIENSFGEGPGYLFIRAGSAFNSTKAKTAEDHFACLMLDELGGRNIVEAGSILTDELSLEEIIIKDPDLIFVVPQGKEEDSKAYIESLFKEDGWKELRAIKEGNVHFLSKELFNYKPNQKWAKAYETLAAILYQ